MNDDEKKAMMMDKHGFIIGENGDDHLNKKMMRELYGYSRDGNGAQSKRTDVKPRSGSAVNGKDDAQRQGDGAETDEPGSRSSAWEDGHDHAEDELFCAYGGDADGGGGGGEDSTVSSEAEQKRIFRALLLKSGDELRSLIARKPGRLKRRVALGIPDVLRGQVWQLFSGGRELRIQNPSVYHKLLVYESSASETDIIHDIGRTFPTHIFFQQRHGPGQRSLFNILKAYSVYDRQIGYVQGMGFVAGLLLLYMSEEDAFWTLVSLLKGAVHDPLEGLYLPGLPLLKQYFFQFEGLVAAYFPDLSKEFEREGFQIGLHTSQWFITMFAYSMKFDYLLRVWDMIMFDGPKTVFRVGLAIVHYMQPMLRGQPFENIAQLIRNPAVEVEPDDLIKHAFTYKISKRLKRLKLEYKKLNVETAKTSSEAVDTASPVKRSNTFQKTSRGSEVVD